MQDFVEKASAPATIVDGKNPTSSNVPHTVALGGARVPFRPSLNSGMVLSTSTRFSPPATLSTTSMCAPGNCVESSGMEALRCRSALAFSVPFECATTASAVYVTMKSPRYDMCVGSALSAPSIVLLVCDIVRAMSLSPPSKAAMALPSSRRCMLESG